MAGIKSQFASANLTGSVPREIMVITEPDLHRVVAFSLDTPTTTLAQRALADGNTSVGVPILYSIGSLVMVLDSF